MRSQRRSARPRPSWPSKMEQHVFLGIGMPPILAEDLRLRDAHFGSASRSPPRLHFQVFVDTVLAEQPVSLTGVTGQHVALHRERPG